MTKWQGSLLGILTISLTACSTGSVSDKANYPITSLYTAIERAMGMGVHHYSENHRELYSRPFLIKQEEAAKKQKLHERGLAKVTILGEQRPYTIEVEVTIQRAKSKNREDLTNDDYENERHDERLAKKLLMNIMAILDKRERDKNIIDDFRPF